jgi:hypothetical protein
LAAILFIVFASIVGTIVATMWNEREWLLGFSGDMEPVAEFSNPLGGSGKSIKILHPAEEVQIFGSSLNSRQIGATDKFLFGNVRAEHLIFRNEHSPTRQWGHVIGEQELLGQFSLNYPKINIIPQFNGWKIAHIAQDDSKTGIGWMGFIKRPIGSSGDEGPLSGHNRISRLLGGGYAFPHGSQLEAIYNQDPYSSSYARSGNNEAQLFVAGHWFFPLYIGVAVAGWAGIYYGLYCMVYAHLFTRGIICFILGCLLTALSGWNLIDRLTMPPK